MIRIFVLSEPGEDHFAAAKRANKIESNNDSALSLLSTYAVNGIVYGVFVDEEVFTNTDKEKKSKKDKTPTLELRLPGLAATPSEPETNELLDMLRERYSATKLSAATPQEDGFSDALKHIREFYNQPPHHDLYEGPAGAVKTYLIDTYSPT